MGTQQCAVRIVTGGFRTHRSLGYHSTPQFCNRVRFSYKDYRNGACKKEMELDDTEFIRRFAMHIPPSGFVRIRHYGILSSTSKKLTIPKIREQLPAKAIEFIEMRKIKPYNSIICPCCGQPAMVTVETILSRGPPRLTAGKNTVITTN